MNKKIIILILVFLLFSIIILLGITFKLKNTKQLKRQVEKGDIMSNQKLVYLLVNGYTLKLELVSNKATNKLKEILEEQDITIEAVDYGNFEKVGELGFSLPTSDKYTNVYYGDIVLYQGNKISLLYNSNIWNYTKIGHIKNITKEELTQILGTNNVKMTLTMK